MKKLLSILIFLSLTVNCYGYFEISEDIARFYSPDGSKYWFGDPVNDITWDIGVNTEMIWRFNLSAGDVTMTIGNNSVTFDSDLTADRLYLGDLIASSAQSSGAYFYDHFDQDNTIKIGGYFGSVVARSTAAMTSFGSGVRGVTILDSLNTQNWTNVVGLRGVQGDINIETGSTGTITGAASLVADASIADAAIVTNLYGLYVFSPIVPGSNVVNEYGIYIEDINKASTLNYGIYTNKGLVHLGDSVDIATGKNFTLGTTQWNSSDEIDGTKIKDADYGDVDVSAGGAWTVSSVQADSVVLGTDTTGNYVADVADGTGIDGTATGEGSTYTPVFDATELDDVTWSDGSNASNVHTYDVSGQDHTMTAGDGLMTFSHDVNVLGRFIPNDNGVSTHLLAAYWPFDSNDVAYDYSGNGHDGTITGTPVTVDGRFGAALDFDATNPDNILVPDNGLEPASITVSVWVKTTQDDQDIYRQWEGAPNRCLALNIDSSDRAVFSITNNGTNIFSAVDLTGTSVSDGEWHLLTGTYESPNVRLYIDSVLVRTNSGASGDLCAVNADVKIADNFVRTNNYDGLLDEMMVFGRALSAEEIKSLYESNRQLKDERLFPVYDDLPPSPIIGAKLGSTAPTLATFVSDIQQYTFDATNDFVIGSTEVTHGWKEGTIITPHIHWATNGLEGTAQGVQWQLKLIVGDSGEAFSAQATTVVDATIPASTPDRTHFMTDFDTTIDGADLRINAYICWRLERIATAHGNGEPAADPFGLAVGFHVEMDTAGSFTATTK